MMKGKIVFAPASMADVKELAALETDLFSTDRCSKRSFRHLISHAHVVVAKHKELHNIVGYAILLGRKNSRKMRIYSFGIIAAARNKGLAGELLASSRKYSQKRAMYYADPGGKRRQHRSDQFL